MKGNRKKRIASALLAAVLMSASMGASALAAEDQILLDEDFDGYAAEGENLIGKLIRTQDKLDTDGYPNDVWSVNAVAYTNGNSITEPAAFVHSPYGEEDNFCAYYYAPPDSDSSRYDQLIYNFGNILTDGDTLIFEGRIKNTLYYQNGASSGNFGNSFELGLSGTGGYSTVLAIDSGVTLGKSGKDWGLYNLAGDWLHFSLSVKLNAADMSNCPVNLVLSGYTIQNNPADYTRSSTVDLSRFTVPENIDSVRHRGVIQADTAMSDPGDTIDTQRHGIYFDDAKIIKAGDFEMTLGESEDYSKLSLSFNHSFNTKLNEEGGYANVGAESFEITDGAGNVVDISNVEYNVIDPTYVTLTLDQSQLTPNTTYTVTSTVRDVLGNTPGSASFTTSASAPQVSDVSSPEKFADDTSVAYAYTFTVTPNNNTITGVRVISDTELTGSTEKTVDLPSTESEIKFGIIAVHELAGNETADSVTAPEFTAEAIY